MATSFNASQREAIDAPNRNILVSAAAGSGKTTVISLLMRFYDVGSGSVRINGRDVRTIPE